jgi:hypothetical protein
MINIKNTMYKMMISCDKATYYSDMSQYKKLNFSEKIKFETHLLSCKPCSDYHKQNKIITEKIKSFSLEHSLVDRLSADKKRRMKREIEKNI